MRDPLTPLTAREHQELVLENIRVAVEQGDYNRAEVIRKAFAPLLAIKLPDEPDPNRIPASPINSIPL